MSYGRVNVSNYLRNLNVQEPVVEETYITDEDLAKDLALFTNTQFFDFDSGQHTDYQAPPVKPEVTTTQSPITEENVTPTDPLLSDFSGQFDFSLPGDFGFGDFSSTYTSPTIPAFPDPLGNHHHPHHPLQPLQPNPQTAPAYPAPPAVSQAAHAHHTGTYVPPPGPGITAPTPAPTTHTRSGSMVGEKRKVPHEAAVAVQQAAAANGRVLTFDEAARLAAEEDKRRRNTAASARFRIKKKQREQALERTAKEMGEKVTILEGRISALETENRWLKSLVTEKHGGRDDILEKLLKEFAAAEKKEKEEKEKREKEGSETNGVKKEEKKEGSEEVKDSITAATTAKDKSSSPAAAAKN